MKPTSRRGDPMVRATVLMRIRPGAEAAFEDAWREVADRVADSPGNLRQALLRDPSDAGRYTVTSDWDSAEAFSRFERSSRQDALTARLRELRESVDMHVDELLVHVPGRGGEEG